MEIKSRFSTIYFYVPLAITIVAVLGGFYIGLYTRATGVLNSNKNMPALALVFGGALFAWLIIRNARAVSVNTHEITIRSLFSKKVIVAANISAINNFERGSLGFLRISSTRIVNGIGITMQDGGKVFLYTGYYKNTGTLKQALYANFGNLITSPSNSNSTGSGTAVSSGEEKFAGNPLFSVHGMAFSIFLVIMFVVMAQTGYLVPFWQVFAISAVVLYLGSGGMLNYFIVSGNKLIIKNHIWWWRNIQFDLDDIKQAVAEHHYKTPNSLCINFKNFTTKNYAAGSLYNKTWKKLLERLASAGIESISEI